MSQEKILVIDDEAPLRERLVKALTSRGFEAHGAATLEEGTKLAKEIVPQKIILDLRLPDGVSIDHIAGLKACATQSAIVILTGYGSIPTALKAVREGATNFLTKPATIDEILAAFEPHITPKSHKELPSASLDTVEREHIERVLNDCGGNISKAARVLGIHRRSLQRKLR